MHQGYVERALLASIDCLGLAVILADENGRVVFLNNSAQQLLRCAEKDFLGKDFELLLAASDAQVHDFLSTLKLADAACGGRLLMQRIDGTQILVAYSMMRYQLRSRMQSAVLLRDVTVDVELRRNEKLMSAAVDHIGRPVVVMNDQRCIVYINNAFTSFYGYTLQDVQGLGFSAVLCSPNMPNDEYARLLCLPWGRESVQEDVLLVCKDGSELCGRIFSAPVNSGADDDLLGYSVDVILDITEDRRIRELERDVLEVLTSNLSFLEFGDYLCRRLEEITPSVIPSILLVDADGRLRPWAVSRLPAAYSQAIDGVPAGDGVGSCGTTVVRGEPILSIDIANDSRWQEFSVLALAHGLRACWSYPIKRRDGSVAGSFAFYCDSVRGPSRFHQRIIDACVHFCTLAIEREENRLKMSQLSRFDVLTGLPNRQHLHAYLDGQLESEAVTEIAVFCLDIDRFNDVNGTFGHAVGDQLLITISNRLRECVSPLEFLARTEGDQFIAVAPNCDLTGAVAMAARFHESITAPIAAGDGYLHLTVSIGIGHHQAQGRGRDGLLHDARNAMYQAKAEGCGLWRLHAPEADMTARDRILLGAALHRAIEQGGLSLHYQPQVWLDSGELYGVEALTRWSDPEFGDFSPERFILLAEEIGLVDAIGRWALAHACWQMSLWRKQGVAVPRVSVNLSPISFRNQELPRYVAGLLREYELSGDSLTIEITESTAMTLGSDLLDVVQKLRDCGVGLSVDDFGTGYSSLSNLVRLPVTEVKIDKSFVDRSLDDPMLSALVEVVIGIGRSLGLTVVAEGVENEAQKNMLIQRRCPVAQGYIYSRPVSAQDMPDYLAKLQAAAVARLN